MRAYIAVLLVFLTVAGTLSSDQHLAYMHIEKILTQEDEDVIKVQALLNSKIYWFQSGRKDSKEFIENTRKFQENLKQIAKYNTDIIKKAMIQYSRAYANNHTASIEEKTNLFIINRYLFNITDNIKPNLPQKIGWKIVNQRKVGLLWPLLSVDKKGNITLAESNIAYMGQPYFPLEEFEYFLKHFGRRKFEIV